MGTGIHPAPAEFTREQISTDPVLRYFHYAHLPMPLQAISEGFCTLAVFLVTALPRNAERSVALRKLLEAKDAAVRANLPALDEQAEESRSTARQDDKPGEEIDDNTFLRGGDQSDKPIPFRE